MLRVNLDISAGLANGSRGVIQEVIDDTTLLVKFLKVTREIGLHRWELYDSRKKLMGYREQMPLILGWAMTIHKSQSMTVDYMICDIGSTVFADGQAYVCLSRCRNYRGLFLQDYDTSKIKASKEALSFNRKITRKARKEGTLYA